MNRPDSYLDRPLYRWTDRVYRLMVLTTCFLLTAWPGLVALLLLTPTISNAVLYAVAALPAGPGIAAALYAARKLVDGDDGSTWSAFWRGYGQNWRDALKVWAPVVVVATIVAVDLAWLASQQSAWTAMASTMVPLLAVLASPFVMNALVLVSWFSFRTRDAARLSGYYTFMKPLATLGLLLVLGAVGAVVVGVSDWAGFLVAGVAAYGLAVVTAPTVDHATVHFVHQPGTEHTATGDADHDTQGGEAVREEDR